MIGRLQLQRRANVIRSDAGFTLIELAIVVGIVAILASIAYPTYQDSVRKSRRAQVQAEMVEYAQAAERSHTINNTYAQFKLTEEQKRSPQGSTGNAYYTVAVNGNASTFTLTATPQLGQAEDECGILTLNQAGTKGAGSTNSAASCW